MRNRNTFYKASQPLASVPPERRGNRPPSHNTGRLNSQRESWRGMNPQKRIERVQNFQEELGKLCCTSNDGVQWYLIQMDSRGTRYEINRLSPNGSVSIDEHKYCSEIHAALEARRQRDVVNAMITKT